MNSSNAPATETFAVGPTDPGSITHWYHQLQQGGEAAAHELWNHFFERLTQLAGHRLNTHYVPVYDAEDAALSAFKSLVLGARKGRFSNDLDRERLWQLLATMTLRKVYNSIAWQNRAKRRGSATTPLDADWNRWIQQGVARDPQPQEVAEFRDELQHLMGMLGEYDLQHVALLKLQGHSNREIAEQMGRGLSTIERKLRAIRKIWELHLKESLHLKQLDPSTDTTPADVTKVNEA